MTWKTPETAPKTGEMILADVGMPRPVLACWNECDNTWAYASPELNKVHGVNDPYFETGWEKTIKRWMPLPEFPND